MTGRLPARNFPRLRGGRAKGATGGRESQVIQVMVTGRHFEITDAIRRYAEEKIARLDKHFDRLQKADLVLAWENEQVGAELTVPAPRGQVLVARADHRDLYAAIDQVVHRMERQIDRYKGRLTKRRGGRARTAPGTAEPGTSQPT